MERALDIWKQHPDLPALDLRSPWHGYTLGHWSNEDQRFAELIANGDYRALGRITAERQIPVRPDVDSGTIHHK